MKGLFTYLKGDKVIWMISLILALLSLISVYSFTPILTMRNELGTETFLFKHAITLVTGFVLMFYAHTIPFKYYSRLSQVGIWIAVILLLLTLVAGVSINSAGRWLVIPIINQKFQTSDFAKIALIIFVARQLTVKRDKVHDFKEGVLPILIPVGLICGLILPENFSTAGMLFGLTLIMMFIGRVKISHIGMIIGGAVLLFLLLILIAKVNPEILPRLETWSNRLTNYQSEDPKEQWQINNALMAIENGGLMGKGPGNGQLKHILPQAYADFVFASFIEEFGMFGGFGLLLLYLILFFRVVRIAGKCEKNFGSIMVVGLALNLLLMAFINMAVCTKIFPVTGQNMPLISMGGTSTWFTCISLGIILSVSRSVAEEEPEKNKEKKQKQEGGEYGVA